MADTRVSSTPPSNHYHPGIQILKGADLLPFTLGINTIVMSKVSAWKLSNDSLGNPNNSYLPFAFAFPYSRFSSVIYMLSSRKSFQIRQVWQIQSFIGDSDPEGTLILVDFTTC
jgi:hypothetical protein